MISVMTAALVAITVLTAAANLFSAIADFVRYQPILDSMAAVGVPRSLLPLLGVLKAAGAIGILAGLALPWLGTAAAAGLVAFFLAAIGTHLRARDFMIGVPAGFLVLSAATLGLGVVS